MGNQAVVAAKTAYKEENSLCLLGREAVSASPAKGSRSSPAKVPAAIPDSAPVRRRDALTLELETKELERMRKEQHRVEEDGLGLWVFSKRDPEPKTNAVNFLLRQRELIEQENAEMDKSVSYLQGQGQAAAYTMRMMLNQRDMCRQRQAEMQETCRSKLEGLRQQLADLKAAEKKTEEPELGSASTAAASSAAPPLSETSAPVLDQRQSLLQQRHAELQACIASATFRRDELQRRLDQQQQEAPEDEVAGGSGEAEQADAQGQAHQARSEMMQVEHELLKKEFVELQKAEAVEKEAESKKEEEVKAQMQALRREEEQVLQINEDDKVCFESEFRELRQQRDARRDEVNDSKAEAKRLSATLEEYRRVSTPRASSPAREAHLAEEGRLMEEESALLQELEAYTECEQTRHDTIANLEAEQEELVDAMCRMSGQVALVNHRGAGDGAVDLTQALEVEAADLETMRQETAAKCQVLASKKEVVQKEIEEVRARSGQLRQQYEAEQRKCDERMLMSPQVTRFGEEPEEELEGDDAMTICEE